jgi:hypothetical protein
VREILADACWIARQPSGVGKVRRRTCTAARERERERESERERERERTLKVR